MQTRSRDAQPRRAKLRPPSVASTPNPSASAGGGPVPSPEQRAYYADRVLSRIFGPHWRARLPRMYAALRLHHELPVSVNEIAVADGVRRGE